MCHFRLRVLVGFCIGGFCKTWDAILSGSLSVLVLDHAWQRIWVRYLLGKLVHRGSPCCYKARLLFTGVTRNLGSIVKANAGWTSMEVRELQPRRALEGGLKAVFMLGIRVGSCARYSVSR